MEIVTTKKSFLEKKDAFKDELTRLSENNDKDGMKNCIQVCLDELFGEEYKGQFTESEVHILNSLLKALGINAMSFLKTTHPEENPSIPIHSNNISYDKRNMGALVGLGVGVLLVALFIKGSKPLLSGLTIGVATLVGGMLHRRKPQLVAKNAVDSIVDVDRVVLEVENLCDRIDSFMSVCNAQIEKIKK